MDERHYREHQNKDALPGPLTLVLPIFPETVPSIACASLPTAAFRIPDHSLTRELLKICGPLVMPSANLSGKPSATKSEHVELDFGQDFPVLDGGPCQKGLESTILIFKKGAWEIIRQGALAAEHFRSVLGYTPIVDTPTKGSAPLCPGQHYRHYAPKAALHLTHNPSGIVVGFSDRDYSLSSTLFSLGPLKNPTIVAENLYSVLRQLDAKGIASAEADIDFPDHGLWQTIRERLHKAVRQDGNRINKGSVFGVYPVPILFVFCLVFFMCFLRLLLLRWFELRFVVYFDSDSKNQIFFLYNFV